MDIKLDQSSKTRNFNMQLYRNCAPNPTVNTKFYPRRPKQQKHAKPKNLNQEPTISNKSSNKYKFHMK